MKDPQNDNLDVLILFFIGVVFVVGVIYCVVRIVGEIIK